MKRGRDVNRKRSSTEDDDYIVLSSKNIQTALNPVTFFVLRSQMPLPMRTLTVHIGRGCLKKLTKDRDGVSSVECVGWVDLHLLNLPPVRLVRPTNLKSRMNGKKTHANIINRRTTVRDHSRDRFTLRTVLVLINL